MTLPGFSAIRAALLFVAFLALAGCGDSYDWNQKLTVEVETPAGVMSGASVQHIEWAGGETPTFVQSGASSHSKMVGEAVVVDLGGGKYLFALLQGDGKSFKGNAPDIAPFALCTEQERAPGKTCYTRLQDMAAGTAAQLTPDNYPLLVTFDDINDPKSVRLVDPANLAAVFGPGFALKSITIAITDETVSEGKVEKVLGWINKYHDQMLDGRAIQTIEAENRLANDLSAGSFTTFRGRQQP